jgi:hypothetical protein
MACRNVKEGPAQINFEKLLNRRSVKKMLPCSKSVLLFWRKKFEPMTLQSVRLGRALLPFHISLSVPGSTFFTAASHCF